MSYPCKLCNTPTEQTIVIDKKIIPLCGKCLQEIVPHVNNVEKPKDIKQ